jgi:hypothetical protein
MPALRHKQAGSVAAGSAPDSVDRIAITGYVVYVDGTKVKQLDSPSGNYSQVLDLRYNSTTVKTNTVIIEF